MLRLSWMMNKTFFSYVTGGVMIFFLEGGLRSFWVWQGIRPGSLAHSLFIYIYKGAHVLLVNSTCNFNWILSKSYTIFFSVYILKLSLFFFSFFFYYYFIDNTSGCSVLGTAMHFMKWKSQIINICKVWRQVMLLMTQWLIYLPMPQWNYLETHSTLRSIQTPFSSSDWSFCTVVTSRWQWNLNIAFPPRPLGNNSPCWMSLIEFSFTK